MNRCFPVGSFYEICVNCLDKWCGQCVKPSEKALRHLKKTTQVDLAIEKNCATKRSTFTNALHSYVVIKKTVLDICSPEITAQVCSGRINRRESVPVSRCVKVKLHTTYWWWVSMVWHFVFLAVSKMISQLTSNSLSSKRKSNKQAVIWIAFVVRQLLLLLN